MTLLAAALAGLALAVLLARPRDHRLQAAVSGAAPRSARAAPGAGRLPGPSVVCWLTAAAAAVVLPLGPGLAVGLALGLLGPRLLSRLEPSAVRREREQLLDDLPLLLDLLAACLAGGAPLAPAARALSRAADGGAPVAAAVARLAAEARLDARARGEQAARRVGVVAVAPLGLCFLPAFVLLGVVPVVVGLAAPLLGTF